MTELALIQARVADSLRFSKEKKPLETNALVAVARNKTAVTITYNLTNIIQCNQVACAK